jgi:hypothetical protein
LYSYYITYQYATELILIIVTFSKQTVTTHDV